MNETKKDDAYGIIQGFTGYSSDVVSDLAAQIRARKRYDDEYLANKTKHLEAINARNREKFEELQAELDALGLNMTLDIDAHLLSINTSGFDFNFTEIEEMRQGLEAKYSEAAEQYADAVEDLKKNANDKLELAITQYETTKQEAKEAADKARQLVTEVDAALNSGAFDLIEGDGIDKLSIIAPDVDFTPDFPDFGCVNNPPSTPCMYDLDIDSVCIGPEDGCLNYDAELPGLDGIKNVSEALAPIQASLQEQSDRYAQSLSEAIDATKADASKMKKDLAGIVPDASAFDGFEDYNPPPVDLEKADNHDSETGKFLNDSRASLEEIGAVIEPEAPDTEVPEIGEFNISGDNLKIAKPDFSFLNPQNCVAACDLPVPIQWVVDQVGMLISLLTTLDLVVRILKQLAYLRKIWGRSGLQIDPIDMQIDTQSASAAQKRFSAMQGTAMLVTHPYVIGTGVILVCLAGLYSANAVYQPFFTAYEMGCSREVAGVKRKTGTFFSNQAFVIAHTFAAREGNQIRVDGLNQEEATRMRTCDTYRAQTIPIQTSLEGNLTQLNASHHRGAQGVHLMRRCYDPDVVVPPSARFPPLRESLGVAPKNGACEADFDLLRLNDGIFSGRNPAECDDPDECNQCVALLPCVVQRVKNGLRPGPRALAVPRAGPRVLSPPPTPLRPRRR